MKVVNRVPAAGMKLTEVGGGRSVLLGRRNPETADEEQSFGKSSAEILA